MSKAKKEYYYKGDSCNKAGFYNEDHFVIAAMNGHLDFCKAFLEGDIDINIVTKRGTALELAARGCYPELCKFLIEHGAEVNLRNKDNETPLMLAAETSSGREKEGGESFENALQTCKILIQHGADVNAIRPNGNLTLKFYATTSSDNPLVIKLLEKHGLLHQGRFVEEKSSIDLIHSEQETIIHDVNVSLAGQDTNQDNSGSIWSWCSIS